MKAITAKIVEKKLRSLSSKQKAQHAQRFFKTGKGQYGEGDLFLGITVPVLRKLAKNFSEMSMSENTKLLHSKWHEIRLIALIIWVNQYQKADIQKQKSIYQQFIQNKKYINNWDLVDLSTPHISGHWLYTTKNRKKLFQLVKSQNLWDRRIAVVSTFYHIRQNQFSEIIQLCALLINDTEDLMHKACGWMLREMGKRNKSVLITFLEKNSGKMPRTMLRYSIEKMSTQEKQKYMNMKRNVKKQKGIK